MIGKTIMKGVILVAPFVIWDAWIKERFYGYVGGEVTLGNMFLGYAIVFGAAFLLGELTVRALRLDESDTAEGY